MSEVLKPDPQTLVAMLKTYDDVIAKSVESYAFWTTTNISLQLILIILGVTATVFASLQTEQNRKWTKPIVIISTASTAAIISALSIFHVRDNIVDILSIQDNVVAGKNELEKYIAANPNKEDIDVLHKHAKIINDEGRRFRLMWVTLDKKSN